MRLGRRSLPTVRRTWRRGGLSWRELAKRLWGQIFEDEIVGRSAELAYYFLFSIFPMLLVVTSIFGVVARESWQLRQRLFDYLARVLPDPDVTTLVHETVIEVTEGGSGTTISLGLLFALWAASNGMAAISRTLNGAYDLQEDRPLWKRRLLAFGLTLGFALFILSALVLIFLGDRMSSWSAEQLGAGDLFQQTWAVVQWLPVVLFVITAFEIVYNYAPNLPERHMRWLTPGAVIGVALWIGASMALRTYLTYFGAYSKTYGSLGAVIGLMLWFYLTAAALLIGGEINSEIIKAERRSEEPVPAGGTGDGRGT